MANPRFFNGWAEMRKQAQHVVNLLYSELLNFTRLEEQLMFLRVCQDRGLVPKGLRLRIPSSWASTEEGKMTAQKIESKILGKNISELYKRILWCNGKVSELQLILRYEFGMTETRVMFTVN